MFEGICQKNDPVFGTATAIDVPSLRFAGFPYRSFRLIVLPAVGFHWICTMEPAATETELPGYVMGFSLAAMKLTSDVRSVIYIPKKCILLSSKLWIRQINYLWIETRIS